jgi:hypothetical protein
VVPRTVVVWDGGWRYRIIAAHPALFLITNGINNINAVLVQCSTVENRAPVFDFFEAPLPKSEALWRGTLFGGELAYGAGRGGQAPLRIGPNEPGVTPPPPKLAPSQWLRSKIAMACY